MPERDPKSRPEWAEYEQLRDERDSLVVDLTRRGKPTIDEKWRACEEKTAALDAFVLRLLRERGAKPVGTEYSVHCQARSNERFGTWLEAYRCNTLMGAKQMARQLCRRDPFEEDAGEPWVRYRIYEESVARRLLFSGEAEDTPGPAEVVSEESDARVVVTEEGAER